MTLDEIKGLNERFVSFQKQSKQAQKTHPVGEIDDQLNPGRKKADKSIRQALYNFATTNFPDEFSGVNSADGLPDETISRLAKLYPSAIQDELILKTYQGRQELVNDPRVQQSLEQAIVAEDGLKLLASRVDDREKKILLDFSKLLRQQKGLQSIYETYQEKGESGLDEDTLKSIRNNLAAANSEIVAQQRRAEGYSEGAASIFGNVSAIGYLQGLYNPESQRTTINEIFSRDIQKAETEIAKYRQDNDPQSVMSKAYIGLIESQNPEDTLNAISIVTQEE